MENIETVKTSQMSWFYQAVNPKVLCGDEAVVRFHLDEAISKSRRLTF